jgi:ceramide glucosyltransferase
VRRDLARSGGAVQGMSAWLIGIAAFICASSAVYLWIGAFLVARWLAEPIPTFIGPLPPVTLLRPLKSGVPDLAGKLAALASSLHPGDRLVLGAAEASPELAECERLQRAHAECDIVVVPCREGAAVNPKISKLVQMEGECGHELLILSDSEAMIDPVWLDRLRAEWAASGCDAITTGYRFAGVRTWPQRLDVVPVLLSLWPGLALVRRWGRVDFTLGACTGLRRSQLSEIGGWRAFGGYLAEDRELGSALAARGRSIRLAVAVTTLDSDPLSWREWWRHQRRVALTYRVGAPWGFAGTIFTHGPTASLFLAGAGFASGARWWCLAGSVATLGARWIAGHALARMLNAPARWLGITQLLAGWMETWSWLLSWTTRRVWWSGRWWRLGPGGKLSARS